MAGGSPTVLADLPGGLAYGGGWAPDGRIVVSRGNTLALIPAGGGAVSLLSAADTATDRLLMNPKVLPDGKTVIVTRWRGSTVSAGLWVATIGEGKATDLELPGSYVLGMIDKHLMYDTQAGVLMAVPFDLGKRKPVGPPVPLLDGISVGANGAAQAALSRSGSLRVPDRCAAPPGADHRPARCPGLDCAVRVRASTSAPRYSPDGSRIAVGLLTQGTAGHLALRPQVTDFEPHHHRGHASTTGRNGRPTAGGSSSAPIAVGHWRSGRNRPTAPGRPNYCCRIHPPRSGKASRPPMEPA